MTKEAARLTGLRACTPVVAGAHDVDCSSVGVGCMEPGDLTIIAGTWSINEVVNDEPTFTEGAACRNFVEPGLYLNLSASPTSATNLEWFVQRMCPMEVKASEEIGASPFVFVNREVEEVMNEELRVFYHPFLYFPRMETTRPAVSSACAAGTPAVTCCAPSSKAPSSTTRLTSTCCGTPST